MLARMQLKPAGFSLVLIVIDHALMKADCAVIAFCNTLGIPWAIVKSKMDLAIQSEATKSQEKVCCQLVRIFCHMSAKSTRNLSRTHAPASRNLGIIAKAQACPQLSRCCFPD